MIKEKGLMKATEGKWLIYRKNNACAKAFMLKPTDTEADFEEVDARIEPTDEGARSKRIEQLIRQRYSVSDELAILRQRDAKPEEFAEYNAYAEWCKAEADKP